MNNISILLFGGSGLIGTRIRELLSNKYRIVSPTREEVDLLNSENLKKYLENNKTNIIIYAAGITRQDIAEKEKVLSKRLNATIPEIIAKVSKSAKTKFIYFSSDAVFKGDKVDSPYKEEDNVNPINYYGITKASGEEKVLKQSADNLVIRLSNVYTSDYKKKLDLARKILEALQNKKPCYGILDQYITPTFSDDAVLGLSKAIEKNISGILHFASTDIITNYSFARTIAKYFGVDDNLILPCMLNDFFKDSIQRAKYGWLSTNKSKLILGRNVLHSNSYNIKRFLYQIQFTPEFYHSTK